jgi:hypothetical protein
MCRFNDDRREWVTTSRFTLIRDEGTRESLNKDVPPDSSHVEALA